MLFSLPKAGSTTKKVLAEADSNYRKRANWPSKERERLRHPCALDANQTL